MLTAKSVDLVVAACDGFLWLPFVTEIVSSGYFDDRGAFQIVLDPHCSVAG